ncbi:hypothetical protein BBK82_08175 [Lentzea guizhouensis]|uniref:Uncharacterized protein n=1 Tax=Lentzea guizhouensis TaxID=1586287 RepID=A0A1B2HE96_9PSEU|nr:hypothetical protein BBK82_08175 [Lentzea guizhouensis]
MLIEAHPGVSQSRVHRLPIVLIDRLDVVAVDSRSHMLADQILKRAALAVHAIELRQTTENTISHSSHDRIEHVT